MIQLLHRWIWRNAARRAHKLLNFSETEADSGRDMIRAAELTQDPTLRRLYVVHAADEERHAAMFRARGEALLHALPAGASTIFQLNWVSPGERGLDDLRVHDESDACLLAFLHLSEKTGANRFAAYVDALRNDPQTCALFREILRDETFHTNYTLAQLIRVAPRRWRIFLLRAQLGRLWKAYLRIMSATAGAMGTIFLVLQYFMLLPPFALLAGRAGRREPRGWQPAPAERDRALESQY